MQTIKPHLLVSILFIQMVIPASRCCRTIWMAVWEDIAPPRKPNIFAPEKWCLENYFPLFFKVVPPFPGDMLHNFFGECILHSIWRISSISILRHNPHAVVSLKKRPLKSIKFPPQKPNKSEILTSIVVHDFLLRGLAATSRSREMIIDRWNLNDKEPHNKSPKLAFSIQSMVDWTGLDFPSARVKKGWIESLVLACSESPSLGAKVRSNCTQSCGNSWCWSFPKWFVHQSTYFPTRCYQMLSWTWTFIASKKRSWLPHQWVWKPTNHIQPHHPFLEIPCCFTAKRATKTSGSRSWYSRICWRAATRSQALRQSFQRTQCFEIQKTEAMVHPFSCATL